MDSTTDPIEGTTKNPAELALELYNILFPHSSDVRQRAIQSAMASLGENVAARSNVGGTGAASVDGKDDYSDLNLGPKALKWTQKHGISRAMLDEVFYLTNGRAEITASSVPGASRREMTTNCYLLSGLRGLLTSDIPTLDDSDAIAVCKRMAAYDKNNHTTIRNAIGNLMSGTKPKFTLTGPGESAAAALIKQMTNQPSP